jgi:hypothetical protein
MAHQEAQNAATTFFECLQCFFVFLLLFVGMGMMAALDPSIMGSAQKTLFL